MELTHLNLGVPIDYTFMSILLYVDDLVVITENVTKTYKPFWCHPHMVQIMAKMSISASKKQMFISGKHLLQKTNFKLKGGQYVVDIVNKYK